MLLTTDKNDRFEIYRKKAGDNFRYRDASAAHYLLANLALEQLKVRLEEGDEPTESDIDSVRERLSQAAERNDNKDNFAAMRARLLRAWIKPIIWSGVLSLDGLTKKQSRHTADVIGLEDAGDQTAILVDDAIDAYDEIMSTKNSERSKREIRRIRNLAGFINEATPLQLAVRPNTAKQFAIPTMAFDDSLNPDRSQRIDGIYLDNRATVQPKRSFPYQVGSSSGDHVHVSRLIPEILSRELGNIQKSSLWPKDDRPFATARNLIDERIGDQTSSDTKRVLDRISSRIFNKITL